MFGHTEDECRKKPKPRTEWRPILRQDPLNPTPPQPLTDEEGFALVKKKAAAPIIGHRELSPPTQVQNNFDIEDLDQLFFQCKWAKDLWQSMRNWWNFTVDTSNKQAFTQSLVKLKKPKGEKQVTYAIAAAAIYSIWRARNEKIFSNHMIYVQTQNKLTREHIIQRTLILNNITRKYTHCIEKLLA
ncbi:hypothetical protein Cgig2_002676 [Carnegiea gigantea]|uniref:Reverse transcriptase zinc-binding domain-containing protein n=1 Tax=Carnegiea gigantea TaxID=171969 RepID=A0A9Q1QBM2_9CARY|nr:hypothetical protein Cgig2_002676 [Carnegiea gigantea]